MKAGIQLHGELIVFTEDHCPIQLHGTFGECGSNELHGSGLAECLHVSEAGVQFDIGCFATTNDILRMA
ncbi:MAG: hypothetical protein K8R36_17970 [Planctomycetales bacterium]|nr:hypothetical protein [Planctomycetales bacterium]